MRKSLMISFLLLLGLPLMGWEERGHKLVARGSLRTLPPDLRHWYLEREDAFTRAALEPDHWKNQDADEVGRHRIFCEAYGGAAQVPLQLAAARSQVSPWVFASSGSLPWVIAERYQRLVKAFQTREPMAVVEASGWLCHYIADLQVPLHTTRNRDGKLTGQKGVHKRWETDLLEGGVSELASLRATVATEDVPKAVAGWLRESNALVEPLLKADRAATLGVRPGETTNVEPLWKAQQGTLLQQLRHSSECTGDLLLAAWIEAGRPQRP